MSVWKVEGSDSYLLSPIKATFTKSNVVDEESKKNAGEIYEVAMPDEAFTCPDIIIPYLRFVTNLPDDSVPKVGIVSGIYNKCNLKEALVKLKESAQKETRGISKIIKELDV
jgi:hypothetical protein